MVFQNKPRREDSERDFLVLKKWKDLRQKVRHQAVKLLWVVHSRVRRKRSSKKGGRPNGEGANRKRTTNNKAARGTA